MSTHHHHTHVRRFLATLSCACVFLLSPVQTQAQFVVSDPTNLVQNTTSAISEVTSAYNQIQSVAMQTKQLANQIKNLRKLEISNFQDFMNALNQVNSLIERTKYVARRWAGQAKNFDKIWGKYGPPVLEDGPFHELKAKWEAFTNDAYQYNLQVQADTADSNAAHTQQLKNLEGQSGQVEGQLEASQLNTKTLNVLGQQQSSLINLLLSRGNVEQMEKLEKRRKAEAAHRRQVQALGAGFGEKDTHEPVYLPDFY